MTINKERNKERKNEEKCSPLVFFSRKKKKKTFLAFDKERSVTAAKQLVLQRRHWPEVHQLIVMAYSLDRNAKFSQWQIKIEIQSSQYYLNYSGEEKKLFAFLKCKVNSLPLSVVSQSLSEFKAIIASI